MLAGSPEQILHKLRAGVAASLRTKMPNSREMMPSPRRCSIQAATCSLSLPESSHSRMSGSGPLKTEMALRRSCTLPSMSRDSGSSS